MSHSSPVKHRRALTPKQVRVSGVLLIIFGLFLAALGAALLAYIFDYIALSDILPGTYRDPDAGPVETPLGAYLFIGFMLLFGAVSSAEGIWMLLFGKGNKPLLVIILVLGGIFMLAGTIAEGLN